MNSLFLQRDVLANLDASINREWLVTNGLGGYASGTLSGCNTRRYHGLLVAALRPPVERTVMVAKLDALVRYRDKAVPITTNEFVDGTIAPHGFLQLDSFRLDGQIPVWTWLVHDAVIEQRVWMTNGKNTAYVTFDVMRASDVVQLELTPLCTYRDYHSQQRGEKNFLVSDVKSGIKIDAHWGAHPYRILIDNGTMERAETWYWNFKHRAESERGLDDVEDLFRPAVIRARLSVGESIAVILTAESEEPQGAAQSLRAESKRQEELVARASPQSDRPELVEGHSSPISHHIQRQLILAADQFVVERRNVRPNPSPATGERAGKTIIAGYPWFSDWGRDTMIALPGLTLTTRRYDDAASILRTFAKFVSEGMLPNRFPDAGETPEYNTVDATLWYFVAIDEYFRATGDMRLLKGLYPVLREIIDWHVRGTRYSIRVDEEDGLLHAGEARVQLTWMDAKIGDWVVTPRIGKPVEINALWFNALAIMKDIAQLLRDRDAVRRYATTAERAEKSFNAKYWSDSLGYLCDVVDGPEGDLRDDGRRYDVSLRPNQLLAVSLRHSLLDAKKSKSVVDVCARELWTPVGMRSLARTKNTPHPGPLPQGEREGESYLSPLGERSNEVRVRGPEPRYAGRYAGGPRERDAVYHQGTVWSWLLGPFAIAHHRVYRDANRALSYLSGVGAHLREACVGQVSEIFDGDAPFTPRGCCAQAWGVAEILRAWSHINASGTAVEEEALNARKSG